MRDCFRGINKENRKILHQTVLSKVARNQPDRESLRNLVSDAITPDNILVEIINYFLEFGYPLTREKSHKMSETTNWLRQAGMIRIPTPKLILSVQKISSLITTLQKSFSGLSSQYLGAEIHDGMRADDFYEALLDIIEMRRINTARFSRKSKPIGLRSFNNENLWVTWNEENPSELSNLSIIKNKKEDVFMKLGLGFNLGSKDDFISLVFETDRDDLKLYRPGWGDAKTYYYWQSIKNSNDKYGFTKSLTLNINDNQPEAVSSNINFHIDNLSEQTFLLK